MLRLQNHKTINETQYFINLTRQCKSHTERNVCSRIRNNIQRDIGSQSSKALESTATPLHTGGCALCAVLFSKVSGDSKYDTTHCKDWSLDIAR